MEDMEKMIEETKIMVRQMGLVLGMQQKMMEQLVKVNEDLVNKLTVVNLLMDKALDNAKAMSDDKK